MKKLIDVSTHQGVIDWEKAAPHIDGAILRCGYGMDIEEQDDAQFKRNADECTRLGIPFGVYLYSYADTVEKAKSEAAHVLRLIRGYQLSYPVYLDLEEIKTVPGIVERANAFGDIIEKAGYLCGIYSSTSWWNTHLKGLERFTKWVAQWHKECTYKGEKLDMWQYSSSGKIDGIRGRVDMNYCYRDFPAEIGVNALKQFVRQVQSACGAAVDGIAGPETLSKTVTLSAYQNRRHPVVAAVQKRLYALGYHQVGAADGTAGPKFTKAVKAYQERFGGIVDGEITAGQATWQHLLGMR